MNIEVLADSGSVAQRAASIIADEALEAIAARGSFVMAVSGGMIVGNNRRFQIMSSSV